ncbi:hypothetical protein HB662_21130 [Roseomonas frigidaquae]|uniref:Uncharacterized protein n=1 Tax=Falsiroseomonas frigidaquae TaxID=487318 RepID=A0ABX1F4V6_9PROT|nr:hypothetical protein [Falsiroseomonas frigidaquae]NKE47294.1 hypothetical protein [Falsiroseomonas frigidaquae]
MTEQPRKCRPLAAEELDQVALQQMLGQASAASEMMQQYKDRLNQLMAQIRAQMQAR